MVGATRRLTGSRRRGLSAAVSETIVLKASLPAAELSQRFLAAMARDADVDLVVEGRRALLLPQVTKRLARGGKQAAAALLSAPLFPMVVAILLQAPKLGRTCTVRQVAGTRREVVIEIRRPGR